MSALEVVESVPYTPGLTIKRIFIQNNNAVVELSFRYLTGDIVLVPGDIELYDQILSTFKFK